MPSRISHAQTFAQSQSHIANAREKEHSSAEKATTQKAINRPSDAPAEWVIAAGMKEDLAIREKVSKNAAQAMHVLTATENVLTQATDIVQKVHEMALASASSENVSGGKRPHVLPEVKGLYNTLIQVLNTRFGNRTLLGGTQTLTPAFDAQGNFLGDNNKIEIEIDRGMKLPVNLSPEQTIMGRGLQNGVDVIGSIKTLIQGLETSDDQMIQYSVGELNRATEQLSLGRTQIAGRMGQIDRALNNHGLTKVETADAVSKIEEADPIKVFSELTRDQGVLKAALETTHRLLNEVPGDLLLRK